MTARADAEWRAPRAPATVSAPREQSRAFVPKRRQLASIDRRGDTFRIRLQLAGRRYTFTVATTRRQEAEEFAIAKYLELRQARDAREARSRRGLPLEVRFSLAIDVFRTQLLPRLARGTQEAYEDSLKPLTRYFVQLLGDPRLEDLEAGHVEEYLTWRATHRLRGKARLHNRTLQKDRAVLHRLFEHAVRLRLCPANPVALTEVPAADTRSPVLLTDTQYDALIAACDASPMLRLYVLVLGEAGLRCESEALWLRWEDVDLREGFLEIVSGRERHRTKGGRSRFVPMTPRLLEAMRAHFARYRFAAYGDSSSPWVFHHERTRRRARAGDRVGSLRASFAAAAKRAKLPAGLHQHDLRHRRVTTWLADEKNPVHVKEAMGHADLRTTMGYQHLAKEHLRSLVTDPAAKGPSKQARG